MGTSGGRSICKTLDKTGRRLAITYRPIGELKRDSTNPHYHPPRQVKQIANSMATFDVLVPVLVDAQNSVIAGEGRILAALLLGLKEMPTISVEHLTETQIKAFRLADNKLTTNAVWNERLLGEELKFLAESELDFSIEVTGFEMPEIDMHIEGLTEQPGDDDRADALPDTQMRPSVTHIGDRWLLGECVVICGNALDEASYQKLMQSERAAMVFADPPYNVAINGNVSGLGAIHHRDFAMACGEMSKDQFTAFLTQIFFLIARYSRDGALHFICMDWRHMTEVLAAGGQVYDDCLNLCVWAKNHTGMGAFYRSRHELIFVYKHGRAPHRNNIMLGKYGRDRTNLWAYPSPRTPSEEGNLLALHPTVKPVRLIADAILDCTARGDIVLDCCLGSGTSVIAAERTGRRCFGLELDPLYVDTVVRRWQSYTGGKPCTRRAAGPSMNSRRRSAMPDNRNSEYEIGYGKPPMRTRFRPGESGNPRGRPREAKNLALLLEEELKQRVTINENGRRRRITKQEAIVKHMVNKALSGDPRLLQLLLNEIHLREMRAESSPSGTNLDEGDREVIRQIQERIKILTKEVVENGSGNGTNAG
jgi:DNA modification methylase